MGTFWVLCTRTRVLFVKGLKYSYSYSSTSEVLTTCTRVFWKYSDPTLNSQSSVWIKFLQLNSFSVNVCVLGIKHCICSVMAAWIILVCVLFSVSVCVFHSAALIKPLMTWCFIRNIVCFVCLLVPSKHSFQSALSSKVAFRIARACKAFCRLQDKVWNHEGLSTKAKPKVCRAVILPFLLYPAESWVPYSWHSYDLNASYLPWMRKGYTFVGRTTCPIQKYSRKRGWKAYMLCWWNNSFGWPDM